MDKGKNLIRKLEKFKQVLSKEKRVDKMFLFGSRATGKAKKNSDVDLMIVSPSFKGIKYGRAIGLRRYWKLPYPVDFLCYTPEEFEEKSEKITIVREALKTGIEIK